MNMKKKKMVAITIDPDLHEFYKSHARLQKKTVSGMISEHIFKLSASIALTEKK